MRFAEAVMTVDGAMVELAAENACRVRAGVMVKGSFVTDACVVATPDWLRREKAVERSTRLIRNKTTPIKIKTIEADVSRCFFLIDI